MLPNHTTMDDKNIRSRSSARKKTCTFISNILKKKKISMFEDISFQEEMHYRARSEPSVSMHSCCKSYKKSKNSSASTLSLIPINGSTIEEMDAIRLRLSRTDNPFIQKVLASKESMLDYAHDTESDDAILMDQVCRLDVEVKKCALNFESATGAKLNVKLL
uniref:(northern house mosquito) hypothetical protein n=1 Tax=Culex pipiens TaxID=7175 RepID=A0A8D8KYA8_CULPI